MCEGDYFVLLSADDLLTPGCPRPAPTALMEAEPTVGLVYGHPLSSCDEVPRSPPRRCAAGRCGPAREWIARRCRKGDNCIFCPEVVVRGSVQRRVGGYNADLPHAGDLEMWLRVAAVADVGRVNGANQAYYRIHDQSMMRTVFAGLLRDLNERRAAFASVLLDPDFDRGDGAALYAAASRAQARTAIDRVCWALDNDQAETVPIDELLAFARDVWPDAPRSRQWRAMARRRSHVGEDGLHGVWGLVAAGHRLERDLSDRVRWRRRRWSGV